MGYTAFMHASFLVVGAGLAGLTAAEQIAARLGKDCLVIDRRDHIGGNCHDMQDEHGVLVHPYGPHYFRTDSERVVNYLSRFTDWHPVRYRVQSCTKGRYWSFPVNLRTFEQLMGRECTEEEFRAWLDRERTPEDGPPANSEELMLRTAGKTLYRLFFAPYTLKQWGVPATELAPSVCGRIPIRTNRDDSYLKESFQALPRDGYAAMFRRMSSSPLIRILTSTSFEEVKERVTWDHLIYTGPLDAYFNYSLGRLPYRSLRFEREHFSADQLKERFPVSGKEGFWQPEMQVNYPDTAVPWTRIVELKHATGQQVAGSTVIREYPDAWTPEKEPYYPIPSGASDQLAEAYRKLTKREKHVTFIGRLAQYRYLNMDQVVLQALECADALAGGRDNPA